MKKQEEKYSLRLTKNQLSVVRRALEVFERAQLGQFKISLEQIFQFEPDKEYRKNLKEVGRDEYNAMEQLLKTVIFNRESGAQQSHSYFGITGTSESAKISYEIDKVIDQFLAVERNGGYWETMHRCYDDPLDLSQEPIPEIVEFKKYKDYPIPKEHWDKLRKLWAHGDLNSMWDIVKPYIPEDIEASEIEIYPFSNKLAPKDINGNYFDDICIRMWKPRKKDNDETE